MSRKEKRIHDSIINPDKTEKLQKDWKGYGRAYTYYGLIVLGNCSGVCCLLYFPEIIFRKIPFDDPLQKRAARF